MMYCTTHGGIHKWVFHLCMPLVSTGKWGGSECYTDNLKVSCFLKTSKTFNRKAHCKKKRLSYCYISCANVYSRWLISCDWRYIFNVWKRVTLLCSFYFPNSLYCMHQCQGFLALDPSMTHWGQVHLVMQVGLQTDCFCFGYFKWYLSDNYWNSIRNQHQK